MTHITHTTFSLSLGLGTILAFPNFILLNEIPFYSFGLILGAIFPDIDEPQSYIGRKIPVLPTVIKTIFGHRGLTHQLIFFLALFVAVLEFETKIKDISNDLYIFLLGFCLSIFFHQIGDMLAGDKKFKGGIRDYFFPFVMSGKYFTPFPKIFRCVVGGIKEKIYNICFVLIILLELKEIFTFQLF